jgi:hypothetical protein
MMSVLYTACAVEGFGEAKPLRDIHFLVLFAGFAGKEHQKRMILGGLAALQPPAE